MSLNRTLLIVVLILFVDQASKIYIKTHMELHENIKVLSWFNIVFVENEGMAWGTKLSDIFSFITEKTAKLVLTVFRIVAVTAIGFWLVDVVKNKRTKTMTFAVALIFAGALGNIIDSMFYGLLFSHSYGQVAEVLPAGGGYAPLFYGKVVDMLHFPIWRGTLPEWLPFFGEKEFSFFDPVFNVADVAISTGIGMLIVFNKKAFAKSAATTKNDRFD
ncbi:MAG: lipoprotein signal peptidase [Winogradskyella sp.]|uniref:lipoprotein signal peptidase n=1 Tax=Winogradskyella sp. TaxID=1883156 RepID=UPI0017F32193|nr:lipoprotein signal peptidase [Winogradskyella sp.]